MLRKILLFSIFLAFFYANVFSSGQEDSSSSSVDVPTITYWTAMSGKVAATNTSYDDVACYDAVQTELGVDIEFIHPPSGMQNEQFNLLLASQEYPDVIWWNWAKIPGGASKAIDEGVILRLNELIEEKAPNYAKVLKENPQLLKDVSTDEGDIFIFPIAKTQLESKTYFGPILRRDWLDKLKLSTPETIDEWYTVLKAFKESDPNGNSKNDEIPYLSSTTSPNPSVKGGMSGLLWFAPAWGIKWDFYVDDGQVKYGPIEGKAKDYISTMRKWYSEGLIDLDYASTDNKQFDSKVTDNRGGSFFGLTSGSMGKYLGLMKDQDFDLVAAPWPSIKEGTIGYNIHMDAVSTAPAGGAAITTAAEDLDSILKFLDYGYSDEGHMLYNFGIEGVSYEMIDGYPKYTELITNHPDGLPMTHAGARYYGTFGSPTVYDARYIKQIFSLPQQQESMNIWLNSDFSINLPGVSPTQEEAAQVSMLMSEIETYTSEMLNKFVMGQKGMEDFDSYVDQVQKMKIDEIIAIYQSAYDRYLTR